MIRSNRSPSEVQDDMVHLRLKGKNKRSPHQAALGATCASDELYAPPPAGCQNPAPVQNVTLSD